MITRYGMTDEFDMVAMENVTNQYLGGDTSISCSADTQKEIDEKVVQESSKKQSMKKANLWKKSLLKTGKNWTNWLCTCLQNEKETITGDEFMDILERHKDY